MNSEMVPSGLPKGRIALGVLACAVALALFCVDFLTWLALDVPAIYGLPLLIAGATRSRLLLWALQTLLTVAIFVVYALQIPPDAFTLQEPFLVNRILDAGSLLLIATLLQIWISSARASEARARLLKSQSDKLETAEFSRKLIEVQESERRALANQLHDLVGQKLAALSINLHILQTPEALSASTRAARDNARLSDSITLVEETIESIRNVMAELSPAVLGDYGLAPALRWYAGQVAKRTGAAIAVKEQGQARRLPSRVEETLFRIVREALANVTKHARAGEVMVTMEFVAQDFRLSIADDGCGFDTTASRPLARDHGWGLMIMRERATAVGGQFEVESAPGRGTRVMVTLRSAAP